jgi:hypothetical protein
VSATLFRVSYQFLYARDDALHFGCILIGRNLPCSEREIPMQIYMSLLTVVSIVRLIDRRRDGELEIKCFEVFDRNSSDIL